MWMLVEVRVQSDRHHHRKGFRSGSAKRKGVLKAALVERKVRISVRVRGCRSCRRRLYSHRLLGNLDSHLRT